MRKLLSQQLLIPGLVRDRHVDPEGGDGDKEGGNVMGWYPDVRLLCKHTSARTIRTSVTDLSTMCRIAIHGITMLKPLYILLSSS